MSAQQYEPLPNGVAMESIPPAQSECPIVRLTPHQSSSYEGRKPSIPHSEDIHSRVNQASLLPNQNVADSGSVDEKLPMVAPTNTAAWRPSFWRMPLLAVICLIGVLLCTAAAIGVLVYSHGRDVDTWGTFTPSVILATLSVVANSLLVVALAEGLVISFWHALLAGCTLTEAYANWQGGNSLWGAVTHGYRRNGRIPAIARTITFLSLIRSPLFQRASSIQTNTRHATSGLMNVQVAQNLPNGYAGVHKYARGYSDATAMLTSAFNNIMNEYSSHTDMTLDHEVCGDVCNTVIKGFGYSADCQITNGSYIQQPQSGNVTNTLFNSTIELYRMDPNANIYADAYLAGILVNATFYEGSQQYHFYNGTNGKSADLEIFLTTHSCRLQGAVIAYNTTIRGQVVTLSPRTEDKYLQPLNLTAPGTMKDSVIGGFQYAANYLFNSNAIYNDGGAVTSSTLTGALANQMAMNSTPSDYVLFRDPMDGILDAIREISFRASLKAGRENATITNATQSVPYTGYATHATYKTDYYYLGIAAAINVIGILAVAMTFWGWWDLGRDFSSNPIEIAKAFDSPLLRKAGSNVPYDKYPKEIKGLKVKYGAAYAADQQSDTQEPADTSKPGRLVVGCAEDVRDPRAGESYS